MNDGYEPRPDLDLDMLRTAAEAGFHATPPTVLALLDIIERLVYDLVDAYGRFPPGLALPPRHQPWEDMTAAEQIAYGRAPPLYVVPDPDDPDPQPVPWHQLQMELEWPDD